MCTGGGCGASKLAGSDNGPLAGAATGGIGEDGSGLLGSCWLYEPPVHGVSNFRAKLVV